MALPVRVDRPDVAPVAVEARLAGAAGLDQPRQQPVAEVLEPVLAGLVGELLERLEHGSGRNTKTSLATRFPAGSSGL